MESWVSKLRTESRLLDRQIRSIQREQDKTIALLKDTAKRSTTDNKQSCQILAKEIVRSRKTIARLHGAKAEINSIIMAVRNQVSLGKLVSSVDQSTQIMKSLGNLNKMPEMMSTMRELSREMMKSGIVEEMMEDTFESLDQDLGLEDDEIAAEVDKVLFEITQGQLGRAEPIPNTSLNVPLAAKTGITGSGQKIALTANSGSKITPPEVSEEDMAEMKQRLQALRG